MISILFFVFAVIAVASAIMVIAHPNPVYCALFLIMTLFALAGLFVLLNAPFIAAVHIIIYAGAIMVLFVFVIMLLDLTGEGTRERSGWLLQVSGIGVAVILLIELGLFLKSGGSSSTLAQAQPGLIGDTKAVGMLLFTKYLFPFEVASVLILSAIIGSVILAKLKLKK